MASLSKVECIFHEETMTIMDWIAGAMASAFCLHNKPTVASIRTMVPEEHASMTTTLEHFKSHEAPSTMNMPSGRSTAPAVQAIIVNCVFVVNPQLAAIIGDKLEVVMARLEDSQATCPTHREVIPAAIARPIATCVTIVHIVFPSSKVRSATVQVLTTTSLAKIESILHEEAVAVGNRIVFLGAVLSAFCTHNKPTVASIRSMVPEKHTCMTTLLKHLKSHQTPSSTHMWSGRSTAPAVQAIIVNCVSIVNPQLAPIIGDKLEVVVARLEDSQAACPTHCEVIPAAITRPIATSVTIVDIVFPASKIWSATVQVLATATLAKIEGILHEEAMAISDLIIGFLLPATSPHNSPSVASIGTMIPEENPSMTTTLEHLKSHKPPASTHMRPGLSITPAMQAIIVNCVPIVNPQLAPIIGDKTEVVMARLEDSQASRPTNSEVVPAAIARPIATCVTIVHIVFPASQIRFATLQVLTTTSLAEVEGILHE